ncbi:MAG: hypothetical protein GY927_12870 [bacterium]|nr:hypothetical protein [bacterium]
MQGSHTIRIPESDDPEFSGYTQLVFAWKMMLDIVHKKQIKPEEVDNPKRLTKIVNPAAVLAVK